MTARHQIGQWLAQRVDLLACPPLYVPLLAMLVFIHIARKGPSA